MFSRCTRILFLLALGWLTPALPSAQAEAGDAGEIYLRGYALKNEGEKLEAAGKLSEALNAYQQAQTIITSVAQNSPSWQPEVVQYCLQALQQTIARLSLRVPVGAQPLPAAAPVSPMAAPLGSLPPAVAPGVQPLNSTGVPTDPIRAIQEEMARKDALNKDLESRLKTYADAYLGAAQARQKAEEDIGVLRRQEEALNQKMEALQKGADAKTEAALKEL